MVFWFLAALMTAAAVAILLPPLVRRQAAPEAAPGAYDMAVYQDQLAELERDRTRGLIPAEQAEAARVEIARRLLAAADRAPAPRRAVPPRPGRRLALGLMVAVPAAALGLYFTLGSPNLPSQPFAQRDPAERAAVQRAMAEADALARRLQGAPGDLAGWTELGQRYRALGRYADAAEAFRHAVGLSQGNPIVAGAYAEALIQAGNGVVPEQARLAFEQVLAAVPGDPRARYYLALARAQAGDERDALERFQALLRDSPADAPWVPVVRQRIADAAGHLGLDVAAATPEPQPPRSTGAGGSAPAPGGRATADMAAAARLSPEQQEAMIRDMVTGLQARLDGNPDDLQGWMQLGRSWEVLGEPAKAVDAYARAAALAPEDIGVLTAYGDALLAAAQGPNLPPELVAVMQRLLALDAANPRALWFLGVQALNDNRRQAAAGYWTRLLAELPPGSPEHEAVRQRLEALTGG